MASVTIYTRRLCGYCTAAKKVLENLGAGFEEIDVTFSSDRRAEMQNRSGRTTFPQIFIGDTHIGGFTDMYALHNAGKLNGLIAAEPKTGDAT